VDIIQNLNNTPLLSRLFIPGLGFNKRGDRLITSQGLTRNIQNVLTKKSNLFNSQLNSTVEYLPIPSWVANVEEYFSVVDVINNCYKKMLEIGKCREVFQPENNQVPELISATLRDEFLKAKKNIDC
jgi:hypothetical protein